MEVTYQTQEIQNLHQKFSKLLEHLEISVYAVCASFKVKPVTTRDRIGQIFIYAPSFSGT